MKTILVLTDFSDNAANAAFSAMMLARKLHAKLLLFNLFDDMPILPSGDGLGSRWVVEDLVVREADCDKKLKQLAADLQKKGADNGDEGYVPKVAVQVGEGDLARNVATIVDDIDVEWIVMGASTGSNIAHIFSGSDTRAVLDHSHRPVLIIPAKIHLGTLRNVTFATNFEETDTTALHYLSELWKLFHFRLNVVHVSLFWSLDQDKDNQHKLQSFREKLGKMHLPEAAVQEIKGKDVVGRLMRHCSEHDSDLLVMVHHPDSLMSRIFQTSTTKEALSGQRMPLLVIPARLED